MKTIFQTSTFSLLSTALFIAALFLPNSSEAYSNHHRGHSSYFGHSSFRNRGYYRHFGHSRRYHQRNHYYYRRPYYSYNRYSRGHRYGSYFKPVYLQSSYSSKDYSDIQQQAWLTLFEGNSKHAQNLFSQVAQNQPASGTAKVGYALASASSGDLEKGVWAMRRAFKIDPESIHSISFNKQGHIMINDLIDQYNLSPQQANGNQSFMISALHYLKQNYSEAKKSITNHHTIDDKKPSSINLHNLITKISL